LSWCCIVGRACAVWLAVCDVRSRRHAACMAVAPAARQGCATHNHTCQARCFTSWLLRRPCSTAGRDLLACASKRGRRAEPQQLQEVDTTCLSATEKLISLAQRPNVPVGSAAAVVGDSSPGPSRTCVDRVAAAYGMCWSLGVPPHVHAPPCSRC
jgi:hypothetical protein